MKLVADGRLLKDIEKTCDVMCHVDMYKKLKIATNFYINMDEAI